MSRSGTSPVDERSSSAAPRLSPSLWIKLLVTLVVSGAVLVVGPHGTGTETPPTGQLIAIGMLASLIAAAGLYWGAVTDLGLPTRTAVFAAAFAAFVGIVKFVLAPIGFYDINRVRAFESTFPINDLLGAAGTALGVLTLYLIGYWIIYRTCGWREAAPARLGASLAKPGIIGWVLIALVIAIGGWAVLLVLALTGLENLGQYLDIVFASGTALLIAVSLTAASVVLGKAFHSVGKHADAIGDASLTVSFFWLGLAFLALFHALWVVFILVLASIWPIKVVVPK